MKPSRLGIGLIALAALLTSAVGSPVIFTADTFITPFDATFEGQDIVVSNAVLTVDGPHTFASLRLADGAVLTHTASSNGVLSVLIQATNEPVLLVGTNTSALVNSNINASSIVVRQQGGPLVYTNDVDYSVSTIGTFTTLQRTEFSTIPDGATVLVSYEYAEIHETGLKLTITGDLEVESSATINGSGRGYAAGFGTGLGASIGFPLSGGGGGHGGFGGVSSTNAAGGSPSGSPFAPGSLGGCGGGGVGGPGAAGGGRVFLMVGSNVVLNGTITVNGLNATNSRAGGGAAGSLWLAAQTLSGFGTIRANGGNGEPLHGGGGGGGRIAIETKTNLFAGTIDATGGNGWQRGGAGTVFLRTNGLIGQVMMDNGGIAGAATLLQLTNVADVTLQGRARAVVSTAQTMRNLIVRSNSSITTVATNNAALVLNVLADASVESGASLAVDGKGYSANQGTGMGQLNATAGSGAGHGGYGGSGQPATGSALGGNYYGSLMSPTTFGSGGRTVSIYPGGAGGGAVRLVVTGHLKLDGQIKADGTSGLGLGGGASGGSVWLTLGDFSGTGGISANGGSGGLPYGGGGAGGRIAVTCHSNSFTGTFVAKGGAGSTPGSAGTIYTKLNSAAYADLVINNGGLTGTNAVLDVDDRFNLTLAGGGALRMATFTVSLGTLDVGIDSVFLVGPFATGPAGMVLNVASNATIAAGGRILGDGFGAAGGSGPGAGQSSPAGSTGGGHGGYGGRGAGFTNAAFAGGTIYDSTTSPGMPGSGGGGFFQSGGAGGAGLRFSVGGTLLLNGQLSVNGLSAATNNAGGGSGGGLTLTLNHFSGSGAIAANGGSGHLPFGGGGAGGRISITWNSNSFSGTYSAKGGNGFVPGGPGTICLRPNQRSTPDLIFDNGGLVGTNSVLDVSLLAGLTLGPGAMVMSSLPQLNVISNLTIATNARLQAGNLNLTVGSASIASGGRLAVDAASSSGIGVGTYNQLGSSGGGYGGYGGRGAGATSGGTAYGATLNPSAAGSPGGGPSGTSQSPAPGGGVLRMTVYGPMILDGQISANGASASTNNSGGGSGGSVWLTLNQFSGSGNISANGGSGHLPNGGGGGGGRILVAWTSNSFTGNYSAKGGAGFVAGGAGTICLRANNTQTPDVIFDNGGLIGMNTVLDLPSLRNLTIASGASVTSSIAGVTISSNLTIGANATWRTRQLNLIAGSVNIEAGGSFTTDGLSTSGPGPGVPNLSGSSGAGHAGYGGRGAGTTAGGNVYGFAYNPAQGGSPGANAGPGGPAAGGGALRLTVTGPLTLNGRISANGSSSVTNNGGGGSGGSVWLTLNQFLGTGIVSADGGSGHLPNGGGGGGGRIALSFNTNTFSGNLSAKGGSGFMGGGAGTIYISTNNQRVATLIVDNGGLVGTNTVVDGNAAHLIIAGGAIARPSTLQLTLSSLTIASNSALVAAPVGGGTLFLTVNTVNVATNGRITADGYGGASMGAGMTGISGSGGGGHSGYGGRGAGSAPFGGESLGGNAYDLLGTPGMTGGNGGGLNLGGGIGGGALRMTVNGRFNLDGTISANGLSALTNGGGGGAGGSLWLTLNELVGTGNIEADGGAGHLPNGGGGGGGRIAVSYNFLKGNFPTNGFTGLFSAQGGNGFVKGGAGTIYVRTNNSNIANVFVDNGGARGTNTLVAGTSGFDLYVQGGSVATNLGTPRDLFVRSNSRVIQSGNWSVSRNATLDAGGGIDLDGLGNSTVGRGSPFSNPKGGAGHGGYGGFNSPNSGNAYDLSAAPTQSGSRGGNGSGSEGLSPFGGDGGGATHLTVGSTLTLNGEVSADGNDGDFNSGGGSGGSLWIQAATLAGNGRITANGGNGNGMAGGGGGGRIAVYFSTNHFNGWLSACGGVGGAAGGAGTIYLRDNLRGISSMTLDNCGNWGAKTPLSASIGLATNLVVTGSAVAEMRGAIPIFSNLVVAAEGVVTSGDNDTNLSLALLGNLSVAADAGIIVDAKGFARDSGPGHGTALFNQGAGGSYGGWGGDSASGAWSGSTYGSASRPVDRGSGGGSGSGFPAAGSEGGGAIRLAVAGTIDLNGLLSANGGMGWQDDAGGGSGGSIWLSARKFTGDGALAAMGGDGDFFGGGGGGGGRIAIYAPTNTFTGFMSVLGGDGANFGTVGTIFTSGSLDGIDVVAQTPTGIVSNIVNQIALEFTEPVNLASVSAADVRIYTPYGLLPETNQTYSLPSPTTLRVSFNPQNVPGDYRVEVGPLIEGLLAPRMSQVYTGAFSITLPMISGTVTNLAGQPVTGVMLSPGGGLMEATTDVNGNYAIGVAPGWVGTVTPTLGTNTFVPGRLSYTNVSASLASQNYLMVPTVAPTLTSSASASGVLLSWGGLPGVLYQPESSTNLVNWLPYGPSLPGTNGLMQLLVPTDGDPLKFVRLRTAN